MKRPQHEPKTRLNLIYKGTDMRRRIENVQRLGPHGTVTEAIARALTLYEIVLIERKKGNRIELATIAGNRELFIL